MTLRASPEHERHADYMIVFECALKPGFGRYKIFDAHGGERLYRQIESASANNEAEYNTLLSALTDVLRFTAGREAQTVLVVRGDSQTVVTQLTQPDVTTPDLLSALHAQTLAILQRFKRYRLVWQPSTETEQILGPLPGPLA